MTNRIIGVAIGLIWILVMGPISDGITRSFRGFPLNEAAQWVLAGVGCGIILYSLFYKRSGKKEDVGYYEDTICPKCERVFVKSENPYKHMCSDCEVELEPLEGFYDRHPERRYIEEEKSNQKDENN